ncbi:MAG: hypothetical protein OXG35_20930 [Acidobacteria bacterium]|nr:hypothetical protein [Acidobacteriota bacterium]
MTPAERRTTAATIVKVLVIIHWLGVTGAITGVFVSFLTGAILGIMLALGLMLVRLGLMS